MSHDTLPRLPPVLERSRLLPADMLLPARVGVNRMHPAHSRTGSPTDANFAAETKRLEEEKSPEILKILGVTKERSLHSGVKLAAGGAFVKSYFTASPPAEGVPLPHACVGRRTPE